MINYHKHQVLPLQYICIHRANKVFLYKIKIFVGVFSVTPGCEGLMCFITPLHSDSKQLTPGERLRRNINYISDMA